jgi:hypothetical protein
MTRALPLLVLGLVACSTHQGDGIDANELRELDGFEAVSNNTSIPLMVEVGPAQTVEVLCDENLIPFIETSIHSGSLEVDLPADSVLVPATNCEVMVTVPSLERVKATSSGHVLVTGDLAGLSYVRSTGWGDIAIDGIDSHSLRILSESQGRMFLTGVVDAMTMDSSGAGGVNAADLVAAHGNLVNRGSGDITATVTDYATIRIEGEGDVLLLGDPDTVEVDDGGCGDAY